MLKACSPRPATIPGPDPLRQLAVLAVVSLLAISCSSEEIVPEPYLPTDAWDAYRHGLETAGLAGAALGQDWLRAAEEALELPVQIDLPYGEQGTFDPTQALAVGYRMQALRGQRIEIQLELETDRPARIFLDLYRLDDQATPLHVASAEPSTNRLAFEPRRDADYLLRVQPELLRGGRFDLVVRTVATLEFPVDDHDMTDIQSAFGAPRDAGRRSHHGVDIFAPRGTAVLAATRAFVRRVGEQGLGGNVIWLHDQERSLHLYYAHLDSQEVEQGMWVQPGQAIGRVGNSGNAHTTPPHLHFAIYARGEGPLDPGPFLRQPRQAPSAVLADLEMVGIWGSASVDGSLLRQRPSRGAPSLAKLAADTPLRIWAAAGSYYRVRLSDGRSGFVQASQVRRAQSAAE